MDEQVALPSYITAVHLPAAPPAAHPDLAPDSGAGHVEVPDAPKSLMLEALALTAEPDAIMAESASQEQSDGVPDMSLCGPDEPAEPAAAELGSCAEEEVPITFAEDTPDVDASTEEALQGGNGREGDRHRPDAPPTAQDYFAPAPAAMNLQAGGLPHPHEAQRAPQAAQHAKRRLVVPSFQRRVPRLQRLANPELVPADQPSHASVEAEDMIEEDSESCGEAPRIAATAGVGQPGQQLPASSQAAQTKTATTEQGQPVRKTVPRFGRFKTLTLSSTEPAAAAPQQDQDHDQLPDQPQADPQGSSAQLQAVCTERDEPIETDAGAGQGLAERQKRKPKGRAAQARQSVQPAAPGLLLECDFSFEAVSALMPCNLFRAVPGQKPRYRPVLPETLLIPPPIRAKRTTARPLLPVPDISSTDVFRRGLFMDVDLVDWKQQCEREAAAAGEEEELSDEEEENQVWLVYRSQ
ncbi:hypothetical protein WJX72_000360 [[Myrmecia] bisecta]|uniref:Uncharacterized protein n=1 Tax=[Myrmecia] bisecta TaxID=41462 RepID=A0AAW1Q5U6_9CHLO